MKTKEIGARVGRWAALLAGLLVAFKAVGFVLSRIFRLTRSEMDSRGSDVNFVLGLAERRRAGA